MYQLKNIISRKSVPQNPEKNMKAAEHYFLLLLYKYTSFMLLRLYVKLLLQLMSLSWLNWSLRSSPTFLEQMRVHQAVMKMGIPICIGSFVTETYMHRFHDAVQETDGDRILRYWKPLLVNLRPPTITIMAKKQ